MRKFYYLVLIALLGWSCQKDQEQLTPVDPVPEAEISYVVPVEEAIRSLEVALDRIDGEATRAGGRRTVKSIERVKAARAMRAETRAAGDQPAVEDLFYLVSFGEGQGSAVLGADCRLESIYAILDETVLTPEDFDLPATTRSELPAEEDSIRYVATEEELVDFVTGMIVNAIGIPDPEIPTPKPTIPEVPKMTVPTYDTVATCYNKTPLLLSKWGQGDPYNRECPNTDNPGDGNAKKPAGCVPVGIAQMLTYFRYPEINTIGGDTFDWSLIEQCFYPAKPATFPTAAIDELARYIHKVGVQIGVNYQDNGSGANANQYLSFLHRIGLSNSSAITWYREAGHSNIYEKSTPLGVSAFRLDGSELKGHFWVFDGWMETKTEIWKIQYINNFRNVTLESTSYDTFVHCNYGYNGTCDGYYTIHSFDLSQGRTGDYIDTTAGDSYGTMDRHYYLDLAIYKLSE